MEDTGVAQTLKANAVPGALVGFSVFLFPTLCYLFNNLTRGRPLCWFTLRVARTGLSCAQMAGAVCLWGCVWKR